MGRFSITYNDSIGNIVLRIRKDGYEDFSKEIVNPEGDIELGECILPEVNTLQEVVVKGASVVATDGKLLYTPMKTTIESSTYAVDLLGKLGIPALSYNPVNRTLDCALGSPVILINGRPSSIEELQSLSARDVLNVEYSNSVPAIYGSGDFLINVKTRKHDNGGSWNIYEVNDFTGSAVDAQTSLRYYQGSSDWLLNGKFSYRNNDKTYDTTTKQYLSPKMPISINDESWSPFNYRMADAGLQYNYVPSSKMLLNVKYSFSLNNSLRKSYSDYIEDFQDVNDTYSGYSRTHSNAPTHRLSAYLSRELNPNNTLDVNVVGTAVNTDYQSQYDYDRAIEKLQYFNDVTSRRYSLLGGLNYGHLFADRSKLSVCYFLTYSHNLNKYPLTAGNSTLRELHNQVFLEYRKMFGQRVSLYLKTGLNNQHFALDNSSKNFISNISNLNLQWVISPIWSASIQAGYSSNPVSLSQLDDHLVQTSEYLYNNGNRELKPSHTLWGKLQGAFNKNNVSLYASVNYSRVFNLINTSTDYSDELGAYLATPKNGKYLQSVTVMLGGNVQSLFNMFTIGANIYYGHNDFAGANDWYNNHNSVGGDFYISWMYKKWQIYYMRRFPMSVLSGYVLAPQGEKIDVLSVGFQPIPSLTLSLGWSYMFSKRGWTHWTTIESPEYAYHYDREIQNNKNWIRFGCIYNLNFGNPFKRKVRDRIIDLNDNESSFKDYGK
ncbi:MAG: hypothetical protein K2K29_00305 [Muribaculaceae bacterium]|nr:hypothetical protein [Muribaculaceae bacterium]